MRMLLLAVVATTAVLSSQGPSTLTIANVTIIDGTGAPARVGTVIVRAGEIAEIRPGASTTGAEVIDGTGRFLIPGLWDMHVHLATRPEPMLAEEMMLPLLLAHGVVGVRDMGGPLERVLELRSRISSGALTGPRILTPGPFIDGAGDADPMFRRAPDAAAARAAVRDLAARGVDFVKAQAALTPEAHRAVVQAARDAGVPLAGHVPLSMSAEEVIASGQRTIEHISPALVGDGLLLFACSSKAPALLAELRAIESSRGSMPAADLARREAALRQQAVETYNPARARALGASMRGRDVWIVPTLIWSASLRPLNRADNGSVLPMDYVPAALRTRFLERRRLFAERQTDDALAAAQALASAAVRAVGDLRTGGARVLAGTDSFDAFVLPGVSLHQELQLLVDAGFSPYQALQAATREAAAARGATDREGTIAVGKRADLVLLDADPTANIANLGRIRTVIAGGRLFDRAALDQLLASVRAFAAR
jgi:imidazolonepropionase-like amidohydrolase